jgi:hypothetical protein
MAISGTSIGDTSHFFKAYFLGLWEYMGISQQNIPGNKSISSNLA